MRNPINRAGIDSGTDFFRFCWEEMKPELEKMDQDSIDIIASVVCRHQQRDLPDLDPRLAEFLRHEREPQDPRDENPDRAPI